MNLLAEAIHSCQRIAIAGLIYDPSNKTLNNGDEEIALEPRNIALLEVLLSNIGEPTSIEQFIEIVWENQYISKNVVTNRISLLRNLFREHLPDIDSTKLIVTYPKRGYYIPNNHVQLVEPAEEKATSIEKSTNRGMSRFGNKYWYFWVATIALIVGVTLVALQLTLNSDEVESDNHDLYVPQARLLLGQISSSQQTKAEQVLKLKVLLLHAYSRSTYIHLANMRSPSYYLMSLSRCKNFPGSDAISDSDYKLTFNLSTDKQATNKLEVILYHSASERVAWRNLYVIESNDLIDSVNRLNADLTEYFKLPDPIHKIEQKLTTNLEPLNEAQPDQLLNRDISDTEVNFYTRELLFSDQPSDLMRDWIDKVKQSTPNPSPELHMLLALLTYRSGDIEKSLEMLQREYVAEIPPNALILMLQANISRKKHNTEQYLANYLKATAALTITIPAQQVLDHYTSDNKQAACLTLWKDALADIKYMQMPNSVLWQGLERFCAPIHSQTKKTQ